MGWCSQLKGPEGSAALHQTALDLIGVFRLHGALEFRSADSIRAGGKFRIELGLLARFQDEFRAFCLAGPGARLLNDIFCIAIEQRNALFFAERPATS